MFGIFDFIQGKLVFAALFFLVICAIQSYDANKHIHKVNDENSANYNIPSLPTAPVGFMILVIFLLAVVLILPLR